jgi:hypothetical protein
MDVGGVELHYSVHNAIRSFRAVQLKWSAAAELPGAVKDVGQAVNVIRMEVSEKHRLNSCGLQARPSHALHHAAAGIHEKHFLADDDGRGWACAICIWTRESRAEEDCEHFCGGLCGVIRYTLTRLLPRREGIGKGGQRSEQTDSGQNRISFQNR